MTAVTVGGKSKNRDLSTSRPVCLECWLKLDGNQIFLSVSQWGAFSGYKSRRKDFCGGIGEAYFGPARKDMPHSLESLDKLTYWISD
jgi:hypothetical protein